MALYSWNDSYSVGIASLDEQHKHLFSLVNQLHESMKSGQTRLVLGQTLDELIRYTVEHFSAEESIMRQRGYPELPQHKAIHDQFTAKVKALQQEFRSGKAAISVEVMDFLQKWLVGHIDGTDKKYGAALSGCSRPRESGRPARRKAPGGAQA